MLQARFWLLWTLLLGVIGAPLSQAADSVLFSHRHAAASDRIIVKWRDSGVAAEQISAVTDRATRLTSATGINLQAVRNLYEHTDVMKLDHTPSHTELRGILERLRADPFVEYAEADGLRYLTAFPTDAPNDPHFTAGSDSNGSWNAQWYLLPTSSSTPSAISATTAWQTSTGSSSVIVAVVDTGIIKDHPDLSSKLLSGYDFVSCDQGNSTTTIEDCSASGTAATYYFANDGDGWDDDPSDPGDWISSTNAATTLFTDNGCSTTAPSSWHGTKVAGVIGALTNNSVGIAGIAPDTLLLPVRVLGKCVARVSDIAAAVRWAAGLTVSGVTTNANPAQIINLSLGATQACSSTEQDAITAAIDAGVLVVAAAGNEGGPVDAPANCTGVLSVAGLRQTGTKVGYSNVSSSAASITIAAPAGNCVNTASTDACSYGISTTTDAGSTTPSSTPGFYTYSLFDSSYSGNSDNEKVVGTSFSAPMASGVAALMLAVRPSMTPSQIIARMQSSAISFPTSSSTTSTVCSIGSTTTDSNGNYTDTSEDNECICTTSTCGAGMLNAEKALVATEAAYVQIRLSSSTAVPGQHVGLDGSGSTAAVGHTIASYQWVTIPATSDQLVNATSAEATLVVPSFRSIQVQLTITDDAGNQTTGTATVESPYGASTGGGAMEPWLLAVLAAALLWRVRRRAA